jgi:hypothetical protein
MPYLVGDQRLVFCLHPGSEKSNPKADYCECGHLAMAENPDKPHTALGFWAARLEDFCFHFFVLLVVYHTGELRMGREKKSPLNVSHRAY